MRLTLKFGIMAEEAAHAAAIQAYEEALRMSKQVDPAAVFVSSLASNEIKSDMEEFGFAQHLSQQLNQDMMMRDEAHNQKAIDGEDETDFQLNEQLSTSSRGEHLQQINLLQQLMGSSNLDEAAAAHQLLHALTEQQRFHHNVDYTAYPEVSFYRRTRPEEHMFTISQTDGTFQPFNYLDKLNEGSLLHCSQPRLL